MTCPREMWCCMHVVCDASVLGSDVCVLRLVVMMDLMMIMTCPIVYGVHMN